MRMVAILGSFLEQVVNWSVAAMRIAAYGSAGAEVISTELPCPVEGKYYKGAKLRQAKFREKEIKNSRALRAGRARASDFREVFGKRGPRAPPRNHLTRRSIRPAGAPAAPLARGDTNCLEGKIPTGAAVE
jgi:hypothetical protein